VDHTKEEAVYDVDEDAGAVDDTMKEATFTMSVRMPSAWMISRKR